MAIFNFKKANKVTEFTNSDVKDLGTAALLAKEVALAIALDRRFPGDADAKAAGLVRGDIYHTGGALKIVNS